ncbi:hypothetical protein LEMA_P005060.1 [Plenodomus lingam JN3]|uniref:C2H2-type domain-containing protein n=1 Tax=Leptosphaeria maculans (strain JN3 / isolate v23.1.3 / race Av1-4-5-6-7-8) TaxID=985895 RepID=E5AET0_LEPMJ|nr:hypothetical protein LEMA_P005060.1 [Plenodomus lingam JN3]CBY01719.1 hypothetical protein LEMA_P005060.1 [Plenodomus lingam JN3]
MAVLPNPMRSSSSTRLSSRATSHDISVGTVIAIVVGSIVVLILLSLCICLFRCGKAISRAKHRLSARWRKPRGVTGTPYFCENDQWPQTSNIYDGSIFSDASVKSQNGSTISLLSSTHHPNVGFPDLSYQPASVTTANSSHTLTPVPSIPKSQRSSSPSGCPVCPSSAQELTQATSSKVALQYEPPAADTGQFPADVKRILGLDDASYLRELPYYEGASSNLIAAPTYVGLESGRSTSRNGDRQGHATSKPELGVSIASASVATHTLSGNHNLFFTHHGYDSDAGTLYCKMGASANLHSTPAMDPIVLTRDYVHNDTTERPPIPREIHGEKLANWDGGSVPRMFANTWDVDYDFDPEHFTHPPRLRETSLDLNALDSYVNSSEQQKIHEPLLDSGIDWYNNITYAPGMDTGMLDMGAADILELTQSTSIKRDRHDTTPLLVDPAQSGKKCSTCLSVPSMPLSFADTSMTVTTEMKERNMTPLQVNWHDNTLMPPPPPPPTSRPRFDSAFVSKDSVSIASDSTFDNGSTSQYDTMSGYITPATTGSQTSLIPEYKHSFSHSNDLFGAAIFMPFDSLSGPTPEITDPSTPVSRSTPIDLSASASEQGRADGFSQARTSLSTSFTSVTPSLLNEADTLALPFRCTHAHCNKTYRTQGLLRSHINRTHKRRYPCPQCEMKRFGLMADLKRHQRSAHAVSAKKWPCLNVGCKAEFGRKDNLQRHLRKCNQQGP